MSVKKYLPFLFLSFVASVLWVSWCLADINEQGSFREMVEWLVSQAGLQILLGALLVTRSRAAYFAALVYGGFLILYAAGLLGWALMGEATPFSVYLVTALHFINALSFLFHALNDLHVPLKIHHYDFENE